MAKPKVSLMDRMKSNSTIKESSIINQSTIYGQEEVIPTDIPFLNVALSGEIDGGLESGLTVIAGPSKHFKSAFCLKIASAYLKKYSDGLILFYDSEFGTPESYFDLFDIDMTRIFHSPITDIEELKQDIMLQLKGFKRGDHVCIIVDSIGNLASRKEIEDAEAQKTTVDMTRSKSLKSIFRMVTPKLKMLDIPMIAVNHSYKTLELYSKDVVSGGTGPYFSANTIWLIGRQQDKETSGEKEIVGYHFIIKIEKSRFMREGTKFPINVTFEEGIDRWSGMLEHAVEGGFLVESNGQYYTFEDETGEISETPVDLELYWEQLIKDDSFRSFVRKKYSHNKKDKSDVQEITELPPLQSSWSEEETEST
jgi:RecA/RadA recombinase